MTASDTKPEVAALGRTLTSLNPADKDAIVQVGSQLEDLSSRQRGDKPLAAALGQALQVLQDVYQDSIEKPEAALKAVGNALLTLAGEECPAAQTLPEATPQIPQPASSLDLNVINGQLVGLTIEDHAELTALAEQLRHASQEGDFPPATLSCLKEASQFVKNAIAGGPFGQAMIAQAADAVSAAIKHAEEAQRQATEVNESPAASEAQPAAPAVVPVSAAPQPPVPTPAPAAAKPAASELPSPTVPADVDMDILKEYIAECLDHVAGAEASLLHLETNPEEAEPVNTVFRAYHTIKGTSGMLGLAPIQRLAHLSENLLDKARSKQLRLVGGYADLCFKSCDQLKAMINALRDITPPCDLALPEGYAQLLDVLADPQAAGVSEDGGVHDELRVGDILVAKERVDRATVEAAAGDLKGRPIGQALIERGEATPQDVAAALRTQRQIDTNPDEHRDPAKSCETTVRINTDRLDSLIDMVGEIVIAHSMVSQDPDVSTGAPRLQRNVAHTGKIVRTLQDLAMSLRMVPLKATFQKVARLVRDLARTNGKNVQFVTNGEDTEIDRNMVEVLNDPLVHMIRNAVDHGIEAADVRAAAGKSVTGTVHLRAFQSAGNVVIELQDDGKGLDPQRIFNKAVERGLISANTELSQAEIFNLIFLPGFSTAEKVTDVSGRGVGMDVVKRNIEALRGRVEISSQLGQGTLFTLRLPLTMAITDAMLIRVGRETYLLPTVSIVRSFRPEAGCVSTVTGRGEMAQLRGELMPMFRLHRLFGVQDAVTDPCQGLLIVIQVGGRNTALMVDELLGQQQVVIKSLGRGLGHVQGVSGGAILGDGCVGLILDAAGIMAMAHGEIAKAA